jgi:hypothetical protein
MSYQLALAMLQLNGLLMTLNYTVSAKVQMVYLIFKSLLIYLSLGPIHGNLKSILAGAMSYLSVPNPDLTHFMFIF